MSLRDVLRIAYRHKLLIALLAVLAGVGGYLLSIRQAARYEATALVLLSSANVPSIVTNTQNPNAGIQPERIASTQARLARVPAVAQRALSLARERDRTPLELIAGSRVSSDPSSDVLSFTVADHRPARAERLATAYARAYVGYRRTVDAAPYAGASRQLERRLAALKVAGREDSRLYDSLAAQQQQLESMVALQTSNATVIRPADEAAKVQPRPVRALAIAIPAGLLLGLALALLVDVLDSRVRTVRAAADALRLETLGQLPPPPRRFRNQLVMLDEPTSEYGEAFVSLRTGVDLARRVDGGDVLLMTSIARRSAAGSPTVVANLAIAFARAGLNVVLVDLDLRQPSLAGLFGVTPSLGVTEVLLGRVNVDGALLSVPTYAPNGHLRKRRALDSMEFGGTLRVLPVARRPGNPTDVLATRGVGVILEQLRDEADLVLVDAPPLLEGSDASVLSTHVDAVAVIVDLGRDRRSQLAEARRRLVAGPAPVLGFVATGNEDGPGRTFDSRELEDRLEIAR